MRSNTTIVSWTEKPMTVSTAVMNIESSSIREEPAEDREDAEHQQRVVEQRRDRAGAVARRVGHACGTPTTGTRRMPRQAASDGQHGVPDDLLGDDRRHLVQAQDLDLARTRSVRPLTITWRSL